MDCPVISVARRAKSVELRSSLKTSRSGTFLSRCISIFAWKNLQDRHWVEGWHCLALCRVRFPNYTSDGAIRLVRVHNWQLHLECCRRGEQQQCPQLEESWSTPVLAPSTVVRSSEPEMLTQAENMLCYILVTLWCTSRKNGAGICEPAPWRRPGWRNHSTCLLRSGSAGDHSKSSFFASLEMIPRSSLSMWPEDSSASLRSKAESSKWLANQSSDSEATADMASSHSGEMAGWSDGWPEADSLLSRRAIHLRRVLTLIVLQWGQLGSSMAASASTCNPGTQRTFRGHLGALWVPRKWYKAWNSSWFRQNAQRDSSWSSPLFVKTRWRMRGFVCILWRRKILRPHSLFSRNWVPLQAKGVNRNIKSVQIKMNHDHLALPLKWVLHISLIKIYTIPFMQ